MAGYSKHYWNQDVSVIVSIFLVIITSIDGGLGGIPCLFSTCSEWIDGDEMRVIHLYKRLDSLTSNGLHFSLQKATCKESEWIWILLFSIKNLTVWLVCQYVFLQVSILHPVPCWPGLKVSLRGNTHRCRTYSSFTVHNNQFYMSWLTIAKSQLKLKIKRKLNLLWNRIWVLVHVVR